MNTLPSWIVRALMVASLILGLANCKFGEEASLKVDSPDRAPISTKITFSVVNPNGEVIASASLSPWTRSALLALKARLDGHGADATAQSLGIVGPEEFPNAMPNLAEFRVEGVRLATIDDPHSTAGIMHLRDGVGRRLDIGFEADGHVTESVPYLERLSAATLFAPRPTSEVFTVPLDQVDSGIVESDNGYSEIYRQIESAAIAPPGRGELPAGKTAFAFVAFMKDVLPKDARLRIALADQRDGLDHEVTPAFYRQFDDGWAMALVIADLDLSHGPSQWLKLMYRAPGVADDGARLVGLFALTAKAQSAAQASSRAKQAD